MFRFRYVGRNVLLGLLLCLAAVVAGCSSNVRPGSIDESQYGMVISAYKDGQFQLDGAVLAEPDLDGHFDYLKSENKLPEKVLLKDSDSTGVHSVHLRIFTRLQAKFGFEGFVEHKGKLEPLHPKDDH